MMVRQYHQLSGHESEQTLGNSRGQRSPACHSPWVREELNTTQGQTTAQLLYDVVLVSAIQQGESAVCLHISSSFWISFPFRSSKSIEQIPRAVQQFLMHQLFCTRCQQSVYVSPNLPIPPTTAPFPLGIHTLVLYICVSISALQIRSSMKIKINKWYLIKQKAFAQQRKLYTRREDNPQNERKYLQMKQLIRY